MSFKDKSTYNEWNRKRAAKNADAIRKLKSVPCADCKGVFPHYVMEFDHVPERGEKKFSISTLAGSRSMEAPSMKKELAKCDVICANCHKIRTHERNQYNAKPGS